jgi:hypothetical protein
MDGKGEVTLVFGKQVRAVPPSRRICTDHQSHTFQDTHVPREGRDLIRKTLEDRDIAFTVRLPHFPLRFRTR